MPISLITTQSPNRTVLVVGDPSANCVGEFTLRLASRDETRVVALWCESRDGAVARVDAALLRKPVVRRSYFGTVINEELVKKIINENEVQVVYHFFDNTSDTVSITADARRVLKTVTHLLETARVCARAHWIIIGAFTDDSSRIGADALTTSGHLRGEFRAASPADANFASVVALTHAYAISYRLRVELVKIEISSNGMVEIRGSNDSVFSALIEMALGSFEHKVPARIHCFKADLDSIEKPDMSAKKPAARFLIYGDAQSKLYAKVAEQLDALNVEYIVGATLGATDGNATIDAFRNELVLVAPSHVMHLPELADDPSAFNASGAAGVLKNTSSNLLAPLKLATACERVAGDGVHFTYVNAHTLRTLCQMLNTNVGNSTGSNCTDKMGSDTDDCFTTTKCFTDATLKLFDGFCLNAKIGEKTDINVANFLVDAALKRKCGTVDV